MPVLKVIIPLVLVASPVLADTAGDVRAHFKKGQMHYALGEFQDAIGEFREAYRVKQEPAILFNLAQAYRLLHEWQHAYFHYRQYLNQKPEAANRAEVETLIEQMKTKMDEDEHVAVKVDPQTVPVVAPAAVAPQLTAAQPEFIAPVPATPPKPVSKWRYTGYAAIGVGAVAGGLAFVLHNSAQSSADQFNGRYQAGTLSPSDAKLRDAAESKGKLATGALATGVALVAAGAALTIAF